MNAAYSISVTLALALPSTRTDWREPAISAWPPAALWPAGMSTAVSDDVVERVQENIVFLEKPDEIEDKGGYVPSGLLLWGPPGTGKTLMAEAVAGETGKPYVFVDPGAFINMFMGIGVLKVKSLFRKLRKLALRYGGVIVFFDEADSLGRRGALAQQGPPGGQGGFSGATRAA